MYKDMMHRETEILKELMGIKPWRDNYNSCAKTYKKEPEKPISVDIVRVDFNGPATIIFWNDNTKTVAKCEGGDIYDKGKGFLIAWGKKNAVKAISLIDAIDKYCPEAFTRPEPQKKEKKKVEKPEQKITNDEQFDKVLNYVDDMVDLMLLCKLFLK